MEKSTLIKKRLLQVAKNKGISYEKFFSDFGTTYANFKGKSLKSSLRSNVLVDFSAKHPDVDLHWIITGEKKKEDGTGASIVNETEDRNIDILERELAHAKELVRAKDETIASLQRALEIIGDRNSSSKAS